VALKTEINVDLAIVAARVSLGDEDNLESTWKDCAECGAHLYICGKLQPVSKLKARGLKFITEFSTRGRKKKWVN
jgi:ferredoxin-like protein FixX